MTEREQATLTLQGLADQARGRMTAGAEATRQAAHSYAAGHWAKGDQFAEDARLRLEEAEALLRRLKRLGRGLQTKEA